MHFAKDIGKPVQQVRLFSKLLFYSMISMRFYCLLSLGISSTHPSFPPPPPSTSLSFSMFVSLVFSLLSLTHSLSLHIYIYRSPCNLVYSLLATHFSVVSHSLRFRLLFALNFAIRNYVTRFKVAPLDAYDLRISGRYVALIYSGPEFLGGGREASKCARKYERM